MAKNSVKSPINVWLIAIVVVAVLAIALVGWFIGTYNTLVKADVTVDGAWSKVETAYQRRADLIPNLVATVQGAANFEKSTLTAITEARSSWTNAKTPEEKVAAANGMESAIGRLMVVVENYPDLKATQNFRDFQVQLEGTENRISTERNRYNEEVTVFNTKIRVFPSNVVAGLFGFEKRTFFKANEGAENAPPVKFD